MQDGHSSCPEASAIGEKVLKVEKKISTVGLRKIINYSMQLFIFFYMEQDNIVSI